MSEGEEREGVRGGGREGEAEDCAVGRDGELVGGEMEGDASVQEGEKGGVERASEEMQVGEERGVERV